MIGNGVRGVLHSYDKDATLDHRAVRPAPARLVNLHSMHASLFFLAAYRTIPTWPVCITSCVWLFSHQLHKYSRKSNVPFGFWSVKPSTSFLGTSLFPDKRSRIEAFLNHPSLLPPHHLIVFQSTLIASEFTIQ